jgi:hypothetical protein
MIYADLREYVWWVQKPADFRVRGLPTHEVQAAIANFLMIGYLRLADEKKWARLMTLDGSEHVHGFEMAQYVSHSHVVMAGGIQAAL